jgi:integrase/recombinase XerD
VDRLIEDFLADCKLRGMSFRTIPHYRSILRRFKAYLEPQGITFQEVGKEHLRGFIEHIRVERGASQKTVENYFAALSTFYEYLAFEDFISSNPVLPIRKRYIRRYKNDGDRHERKLISVEEMARLVNGTLDIRDRAVIVLLAKTGIRRNELITLDLEDVDFVEQSIRLKPTPKRSNRRVFVSASNHRVTRKSICILSS